MAETRKKPEKQATLCLIIDRETSRLLLAMKKRGFGVGKYNGYGGKLAPGESVEQAAIRELKEESCVDVLAENLQKVAEMDFYFPHEPKFDQTVHVYLIEKYSGEPQETEEMAFKWFPLSEIPYQQMWDDDKHWLPHMLKMKKLRTVFVFKNVGGENIVDYKEINEAEGF